jgi:hypothetical protein
LDNSIENMHGSPGPGDRDLLDMRVPPPSTMELDHDFVDSAKVMQALMANPDPSKRVCRQTICKP